MGVLHSIQRFEYRAPYFLGGNVFWRILGAILGLITVSTGLGLLTDPSCVGVETAGGRFMQITCLTSGGMDAKTVGLLVLAVGLGLLTWNLWPFVALAIRAIRLKRETSPRAVVVDESASALETTEFIIQVAQELKNHHLVTATLAPLNMRSFGHESSVELAVKVEISELKTFYFFCDMDTWFVARDADDEPRPLTWGVSSSAQAARDIRDFVKGARI